MRSIYVNAFAIICFTATYSCFAQSIGSSGNLHMYKTDLNAIHNKDYVSPYKIMAGSHNTISTVDSVPFLLQLDSVVNYFANPDSSNLTNQGRTSFTYDNNYRVNEEVVSDWDNNNNLWKYNSRKTFIYNAAGDVDTNAIFVWDTLNNLWKGQFKHEYAYSGSMLSAHLLYSWDSGNSTWVGTSKDEYIYDGNGNVTNYTRSTWDTGNSNWLYNFKYDKSYDANNNDTESVRSLWNVNTSAWVNASKVHNIYNGSNNLINTTSFLWDTLNNVWNNDQKIDLSYTSNHEDYETSYYWDTTSVQWITSSQELFGYDGNFNVTSDQYNIWDTASSAYINDNLISYSYDINNNKTSEASYFWDGAGWSGMDSLAYTDFTGIYAGSTYDYLYDFGSMSWIASNWDSKLYDSNYSFSDLMIPYYYNMEDFHHKLDYKVNHSWDDINAVWQVNTVSKYFYSDPNAVGLKNVSKNNLLKIYPNPFHSEIHISTTENTDIMDFKLFDISGRCVLATKTTGKVELGNNLSNGIYFYTIQSSSDLYTGKLIKQ